MRLLCLLCVPWLVTLAVAGCGGQRVEESAVLTPNPKALVASVLDLPPGYRIDRENSGRWTFADVADSVRPEIAEVMRRELIAGYDASFDGPRWIFCTAEVYRSSEGAAAFFRLARHDTVLADREDLEETIGDESIAWWADEPGGGETFYLWREKNLIGNW